MEDPRLERIRAECRENQEYQAAHASDFHAALIARHEWRMAAEVDVSVATYTPEIPSSQLNSDNS